jgi:hypothetical protein
MNLGRLSKGQGIAGISAVLLFVSMFLDWYRFEQGGNLLVLVELFVMSGSAWETLGAIPFVLALTIAITVGACLLALGSSRWDPVVPPSAWVAVLGAISFVLILYRIVFPPGLEEVSPGIPFYARPELGIYLALLAAMGIALGGCLAMWEEGGLRLDVRRLRPNEIVK